MLVRVGGHVDVEILVGKAVPAAAPPVRHKTRPRVAVVGDEGVAVYGVKELRVQLDVQDGRLLEGVVVVPRLRARIATVEHEGARPVAGGLVVEDVVIGHLPHTEAGVEILQNAALERGVADVLRLKEGADRLFLRVEQDDLADGLVFRLGEAPAQRLVQRPERVGALERHAHERGDAVTRSAAIDRRKVERADDIAVRGRLMEGAGAQIEDVEGGIRHGAAPPSECRFR